MKKNQISEKHRISIIKKYNENSIILENICNSMTHPNTEEDKYILYLGRLQKSAMLHIKLHSDFVDYNKDHFYGHQVIWVDLDDHINFVKVTS